MFIQIIENNWGRKGFDRGEETKDAIRGNHCYTLNHWH